MAPPPPPPCQNWAGFYIGGFGGYKFNSVDVDLDLGGDWNQIPDDRDFVESHGSENLDHSGAELGGLIGYNFQFNCWVVGLEGSGGYLWARDSNNTGFVQFNGFFPIQVRTSFETHYLGTFGPRVGYSFGRWLPYVTGGLAVGDLEFRQDIHTPQTLNVYRQAGSEEDTNLGWMVGGGLQYAITNRWSVRAQYQFIDLGSVDFHTVDTDSSGFTYTGHHEVSLREHNATFAIIFGF